MEILIKVSQFLLSLSILVVLHELGHFVFAKLFKTRVEKFYMFFNPGFSLFKYKKGETEYGIGWIPLGGYVKISGMIDESMDKEQMALPPEPYEFRSKPAYQRLLIMVGGVLVNFVLAFVIYIAVLFAWGDEYLPAENVKYGYVCDSLAQSIGLQNGDKILELDNQKVERFSQIVPDILLNDPQSIQFLRNNKQLSVDIPSTFIADLLARSSKGFSLSPVLDIRYPYSAISIGKVAKDSPAKIAGLLEGDKIVSIDSIRFEYYDQFQDFSAANKGKSVVAIIDRAGKEVVLNLTIGEDGKYGFYPAMEAGVFEYATLKYTFAESIPAGFNKGIDKLGSYLKQFKLIFSSETKAYKSIGGFGTIASIFPGVWNWQAFWNLTAFLSIILAIMNILPIPALDGGHVMFLMYEIITGRKPGDKFMEYAQITGMVLLFGLLIFANGNDLWKWISNM
ncbi:RIP metalloprotease RseP [Labilibaculum sp. DW002]|uniref:Zinc metalloprotease n=1 Tax=Paralabilibaculum antarcticum TaxID=2912572 RepID=A0ABT5VX61_9BACT|nr:RIP metalloprotease RseP [Labilibaculum sp. DW002]MDE5419352.1 RIP metalloprotease RseP [Labilibaculum sp. DW002]